MEQARYIYTQFKNSKHFFKKYSATYKTLLVVHTIVSVTKELNTLPDYVLDSVIFVSHKFEHDFLDCLNPICSCGLDVETTCHYLLHCPNFTNERSILLYIVSTINESSLTSFDASIVKFLLNDDESLDLETNTNIKCNC